MDKRELRKIYKEKRNSIGEDKLMKKSGEIIHRLKHLKEYAFSENVFCYVSTGSEVKTYALLADALHSGKIVSVPLCTSDCTMDAKYISCINELKTGAYGISEPPAELPTAAPNSIDIAVVPCLSCDENGYRLGYGKGYYDRYLSGHGILKVALCFDELLSKELPHDENDVRMDYIITEKRVIKIKK